jgi:hypothetical protein
LYVSLDNSVRANINGFSLVASNRLDRICKLVKTINPDVVFFSEACRKSFEGGMDVQKNPVYWMDMRQTIIKITGMVYCCECANNFDEKQMSFGVAMFAKQPLAAWSLRQRSTTTYSIRTSLTVFTNGYQK